METTISQGIIEAYFRKLSKHLNNDVIIAGGGPSGLIAAYKLAKQGYQVALFEKKLAPGGGMWGGAMMFNEIIVQKPATHILDELEITYYNYKDDLYTFDSVEATSSLIYHAVKAGVVIFNCITVEDIILKSERVAGLVVNWQPVATQKMHVDPLMIAARVTVDSSGHPSEIVSFLEKKNGVTLATKTGKIIGEGSLDVVQGEKGTVNNSGCVFPGLYVSGMAANNVHGQNRMGPIFGGMLLSGLKVANQIDDELKEGNNG
jgi:thiamine thiazole synthase